MPELHPYDVILRPVITEKVNGLVAELNQVVFEVARNANKHQIRQAVQLVFELDTTEVLKIRTLNMPAKRGRRGRKIFIRQRGWKKAIVTLAEGSSIELFNV
ncbi:MAG: 50S ribosomal protein L23 [Anaerolineae bacterium]|jgi:large subunit ribosomal protein L23|nr:50S ribosomal protein L23 [Anaerolineae bacterium]